ncbi:MAG TPA: hypothetical protein VJQ54_03665, partial [Candidatus Sulfotelmatobacter sp.]|nr:hypothetical protein [Candidatus Sulfotelmatobacter sp.]
DNFLFIHTSDPDHDAFNRVISWVAVFELVVIFVSGVAARVWRRIGSWEWNALSLWGICCSFLLFPVSLVFWNILPKMRFMQFPWRWLLCLSVIFAIFVSVGFRWSWLRSLVCIAAIAVIVAGWNRVQAPWWDNAADLREMQDNVDSNVGYEGTDEYTPLGADPGVVDKQARDVVVEGPARAAIHVLRWDAVSKEFIAQMSSPDRLTLKLLPYPAWRIKVNGSPVEAILREGTGQLVIPVRAGSNQVEIRFVRTWDRAAGGWISVVTGAIALMWILLGNRSGLTR